jgi:hypothetical protein
MYYGEFTARPMAWSLVMGSCTIMSLPCVGKGSFREKSPGRSHESVSGYKTCCISVISIQRATGDVRMTMFAPNGPRCNKRSRRPRDRNWQTAFGARFPDRDLPVTWHEDRVGRARGFEGTGIYMVTDRKIIRIGSRYFWPTEVET